MNQRRHELRINLVMDPSVLQVTCRLNYASHSICSAWAARYYAVI